MLFNKNFTKAKNLDDFWKYEKSHFRPFFIAFMSILAILSLFLLAQILWFALDKNLLELIANRIKLANAKTSISESEVQIQAIILRKGYFVILSIFFFLNNFFAVIFGISLKKSYKAKSLLNLNKTPLIFTNVVSILATIIFIYYIVSLSKGNAFSEWKISLLPLMYFIFMFIFDVLVVREIKIFIMVNEQISRIQILKENSKLFEELTNTNGQLNFSEFIKKITEEENQKNESNSNKGEENFQENKDKNLNEEFKNSSEQEENAEIIESNNLEEEKNKVDKLATKRMQNYEKLVKLPNEKLYLLAKKMNIFGAEEMDKEELITLILSIIEKENK